MMIESASSQKGPLARHAGERVIDTWCMWSTDTPWFEVAAVTSLLAVGNILFGHFEEHKAKWRRLLKLALFAGVTAVSSSFGLRWVGWALIGAAIVGAGYLHLRWLPSHGINGWTGEPKEKYYELIEATRGKHPGLSFIKPAAAKTRATKTSGEMRALADHIPDQFRIMIFNHQNNRALIQTANPG